MDMASPFTYDTSSAPRGGYFADQITRPKPEIRVDDPDFFEDDMPIDRYHSLSMWTTDFESSFSSDCGLDCADGLVRRCNSDPGDHGDSCRLSSADVVPAGGSGFCFVPVSPSDVCSMLPKAGILKRKLQDSEHLQAVMVGIAPGEEFCVDTPPRWLTMVSILHGRAELEMGPGCSCFQGSAGSLAYMTPGTPHAVRAMGAGSTVVLVTSLKPSPASCLA
mmetsp:Transcript_10971/g.23682  ORF Transcript_10971/g.23682 Transcript_10971/m.23682 type:complete len:220 (+) Transcript_10971:160-819(+)|eukprot:CAMPEP_0202899506 /NCGR_PEP_ID=MMETSP1392-20130828/7711_1 /ASSEMBLY_ACC=CAM_ASM_000868 /TAXON_ID=225041 /ORGANISM="Chlamydomonas chlamydogama, Strain SAG 11-48b" /LENGTH=219 /DNA_ID=CAMNT_0049585699 /DNA_START=160 /DNA_END=819 /DNA_ORIENTATION=-